MPHRVEDYEKLGAFFLGETWDPGRARGTGETLLYDAKDLTTHAVIVGMTGSGKTGLGVTLLEEAAIDGIPALVVDPKGDLANLALAFPDLRPGDFEPWVDPGEAARKGMTPAEYARDRAALWRKGLASWGQDEDRIRRLRDAAEVAVYTPGSDAGRPLTVLRSLAAPGERLRKDREALRERVAGTVSGLLALLGIDADPVRSREHILLSNILDRAWSEGRDLDLGGLVRAVQSPGFERIGILDLETVFPARERAGLAMTLNNLLAAPGFESWLQGEALDVERLLHDSRGRPRIAVLSIAHLSDAERMFFMTVLLGEVLAWMRTQSGTSSLRALLYIDEVFGYLPPTAEPPSKRALLTLLKQARAFGLGCVLATQNPVDLDYKALSNAGTWFLGRLQTERDKMRVLDGLEGAAAGSGSAFDRSEMDTLLSGLQSRVFVMNNVHEDAPVCFQVRWAMSYLAGPMTREQISRLDAARPPATASDPAPEAAGLDAGATATTTGAARPMPPAEVEEAFLRPRGGSGELVYRPCILGRAALHFVSARDGLDLWRDEAVLAELVEESLDDPWEQALSCDPSRLDLEREPLAGTVFAPLPEGAGSPRRWTSWARGLKDHLHRDRALRVLVCADPKARSEPDEDEGAFRARLRGLAQERRDLAVEKLRKRYESKLATLQGRLLRAEQRLEREEEQYSKAKSSSLISFGATLLGALFGRKLATRANVGRAASTLKGVGRAAEQKGDIGRAEETVESCRAELAELEEGFRAEVEALETLPDPAAYELEESPIRPRKSDLDVRAPILCWTPWRREADGRLTAAFDLPEGRRLAGS